MGCATCIECGACGNFNKCPRCGSILIAYDEDFNDYSEEIEDDEE